MQTLTSQHTVNSLYNLIMETVENAGNLGTLFLTETDYFYIENGELFLAHTKEFEGVNHEVSRKKIKPYELYLLFDLFENVIDEHRMKEGK